MPKHIYAVHNHTISIGNQYRYINGGTSSDFADAQVRAFWIKHCITSILHFAFTRHQHTIDTIIEIIFPEFTCQPFTGAYRCCPQPGYFRTSDDAHKYFSNVVSSAIKKAVRRDQNSRGGASDPYPGRITVILGSVVTAEPLLDKIPPLLANHLQHIPRGYTTGVRNITILTTYTPPHLHKMTELYESVFIPKLRVSNLDFIDVPHPTRTFSQLCVDKFSPITRNDIYYSPGLSDLPNEMCRELTIDGMCQYATLLEIDQESELKQKRAKDSIKWLDFFNIKKRSDTLNLIKHEEASKRCLENLILSGERSFFSATSPSSGCVQDIRVCLDHDQPLCDTWKELDDPLCHPSGLKHEMDSQISGLPFASELTITSAGMSVNPDRLGRLANNGIVVCVDGSPRIFPKAYRMHASRKSLELHFQNITGYLQQCPEYACAMAHTDPATQRLAVYLLENQPIFDISRSDLHFESPFFCLTPNAHIGAQPYLLNRDDSFKIHKIVSGESPKYNTLMRTTLASTEEFYADAEQFAIQQREQAMRLARQKISQLSQSASFTPPTPETPKLLNKYTNPYEHYHKYSVCCIMCGCVMTRKDYIITLSSTNTHHTCRKCLHQVKSL